MEPPVVNELDPFDLPEWLGTAEVTWTAATSVRETAQVRGDLVGSGGSHVCDLLSVDVAYPAPVIAERWRTAAHQQWTHGQILLVECGGRLTLLVPGTRFTADLVLESLARLAKAVGVAPDRLLATLRV